MNGPLEEVDLLSASAAGRDLMEGGGMVILMEALFSFSSLLADAVRRSSFSLSIISLRFADAFLFRSWAIGKSSHYC